MTATRRAFVLALVTLGSLCLATPLQTGIRPTIAAIDAPAPVIELPPLSAEELSARADATTVTIESSAGFTTFAGTGFVVAPDGIVVTNFHVVSEAGDLSVTHIGNGLIYDATVLGYDKSRDIAVVRLATASSLPVVEPEMDEPLEVGDAVTAVGNAAGGGVLVPARGAVTAVDQKVRTYSSEGGSANNLEGMIQVDADVRAGDSGGPLFDDQGRVIGVNTAGLSDSARADAGNAPPEAYAVPISEALAVVDQVITGKSGGTVHVGPTPFLGVSVRDLSAFDDGATTGAKVVYVNIASPSETAGLLAGDVIEKVDGTVVESSSGLAEALIDHYPGDVLCIDWRDRTGNPRTGMVTLGTGTPTG